MEQQRNSQAQQHINFSNHGKDDAFDMTEGGFRINKYSHSNFTMTNVASPQPTKVPLYYMLLDNESTHNIFYVKKFLNNIRKAEVLINVNNNVGIHKCDLVEDLLDYRWVYYNLYSIANILSFTNMESSCHMIV